MSENGKTRLDLDVLRDKLRDQRGPALWRSLEQLADTEEFRSFVQAEFPARAAALLDPVDRRHFLKLMGASLALAGVSACTRQPEEKIFPYVKAPEYIVPGKPLFFATAMPLAGFATGLLVESHEGRPTKVEGNPDHPASLGATDAFAQAAILGLYDPDRSQTLRNAGDIRPWSAFSAAMRQAMEEQGARGGAGLRLLTGAITSPTLVQQIERFLAQLPQARWIQYEATGSDTARHVARLAFGREVEARYRLDKADVILALDADFLCGGAGSVRYAREFARRRRVDGDAARNRLYAVEPAPSNTGAAADHRLPLRGELVEELALAVAARLGLPVRTARGVDAHVAWIEAVARDLAEHRGRSLVIAGGWQSETTQLLALAINEHLGNAGATVEYSEPLGSGAAATGTAALRELAEEMETGKVDMLVMVETNPVYDAPADLRFAERLVKVPLRVHFGLYDDESAEVSHWHVPAAHFLEAWSDARAYDGTTTILQPLIAPLYEGKSAHELISILAGDERSGYDIVRSYWQRRLPEPFEASWRRAVHDGVVADSALPALQPNWVLPPGQQVPDRAARIGDAEWEILFRPDASVFDGRFANNGWLQELPRPITRLTWDNAAWIAPAAAERLGVGNGDVVEIEVEERRLRAPVTVVPGQSADSITLHLGYGRRRAGYVAAGAGCDAYALRTSAAPWQVSGGRVRAVGERRPLACTQDHFSMEGREPARFIDLEAAHGHGAAHEGGHGDIAALSLYSDHPYDGYAWGMSIDLNACTGCNACVVACQSENNIPVVGKEQVSVGREMHWLRIDRYFAGDLDAPEIVQQPVPCMHCEVAPCEAVCPVNATVHSDEGLNDMVYNRCVGTRYCSNNCPYKVRRFNFFLYSEVRAESLKMAANPDVTVRSRGVMEKCTYCVQRISHARINAKRENRKIHDGEVVTACQAVCPSEAIVFGDVNEPDSAVSRQKKSPRNYALLEELGTRPRTTYLAGVRNPNPALRRAEASAASRDEEVGRG